MKIEIRRVEPGDYKAVQQVHAQPNALRGTLQLPFPSEESWKERIAKFGANDYALVACVEGEIVGMLAPLFREVTTGDLAVCALAAQRSGLYSAGTIR